jgi:hypothetical protein
VDEAEEGGLAMLSKAEIEERLRTHDWEHNVGEVAILETAKQLYDTIAEMKRSGECNLPEHDPREAPLE